jgi:hypothetical protein
MKLRTTKFILVSSACALAIGAMGCTVTAQPVQPQPVYADNDVVYDTGPAIDVNTYPHEVYEGRPVYWVNNRWYYNNGGRWAYYRHEPAPLYRRRGYVRRAPPAYGDRHEERHEERR